MGWKAILVIAGKDFRAELRSRELLLTVGLFAVLVMVIFAFALEPGGTAARSVAPGVLWVAILFAGVIGLNFAFAREREDEALTGLAMAPVDPGMIYLGKVVSVTVFLLAVEAAVLPLFAAFYRAPVAGCLPGLLLTVAVVTVGFTSVGVLVSALVSGVRMRDVLLPVLLFPLLVPLLIAAVKATGALLAGDGLAGAGFWIRFAGVYSVVFLVAAFLTFEHVLEQ